MKCHLLFEYAMYFPWELKHMLMYACFSLTLTLTHHTQTDTSKQLLKPKFCCLSADWLWLCDKSQSLTHILGFHASSWTSPWDWVRHLSAGNIFPKPSGEAWQHGWNKKVQEYSHLLENFVIKGYSLSLDSKYIIFYCKYKLLCVQDKMKCCVNCWRSCNCIVFYYSDPIPRYQRCHSSVMHILA